MYIRIKVANPFSYGNKCSVFLSAKPNMLDFPATAEKSTSGEGRWGAERIAAEKGENKIEACSRCNTAAEALRTARPRKYSKCCIYDEEIDQLELQARETA